MEDVEVIIAADAILVTWLLVFLPLILSLKERIIGYISNAVVDQEKHWAYIMEDDVRFN